MKPRCACTGVVLWLNDPPRYEHKSGASASRYANIGQGAVCQWHTFSTDRSEYEDTKYGTIRKASFGLASFNKNCRKSRMTFFRNSCCSEWLLELSMLGLDLSLFFVAEFLAEQLGKRKADPF